MKKLKSFLEFYKKEWSSFDALERGDVKALMDEYPEARRVLESLHDMFGPCAVEITPGVIVAPPSSDDLAFITRLKHAYNFKLARYKKACQFFRSADASPEAKAAHMESYLEICRKIDYLYRTISEIEGENFDAISGGYVMEEVKRKAA